METILAWLGALADGLIWLAVLGLATALVESLRFLRRQPAFSRREPVVLFADATGRLSGAPAA